MSTNILTHESPNQHDASASYLAKALMAADENASYSNQNEIEHQTLVNNIRIGIVKQDSDGKIIVVNKAALEMLGLTKDQMMGLTSIDPSWNVIHEDGSDFPGHTHPAYIAITTFRPVHDVVMGVYRPITRDRVWILVNAEPQFDEHGKFLHAFCTFTDISQYKTLQTDLQVKNSILNSISEYSLDIISVIDEHFNHQYVSKSCTTLSGYSQKELLEMNALDCAPENVRGEMQHMLHEAIAKGEISHVIGKMLCKDRSIKYISWSLHWNDKTKLMYINGQDVTENVLISKKLEQQRLQLEKQAKQTIFDTEEKKRSDISYELHENIGQIIATAKMYLDLYEKGGSDFALAESKNMLALCIDDLRSITYLNTIPKLEEIGLKNALELLLHIQLKKRVILFALYFLTEEKNISKSNCTSIYRIVQIWLADVYLRKNIIHFTVTIAMENSLTKLKIVDENSTAFLQDNLEVMILNIKERLNIDDNAISLMLSSSKKSCVLEVLLAQ